MQDGKKMMLYSIIRLDQCRMSPPSGPSRAASSLSAVVLKIRGKLSCSKSAPVCIISASPLAARKITGMPCPLNPAQMYCPGFPGTSPTWGLESYEYPMTISITYQHTEYSRGACKTRGLHQMRQYSLPVQISFTYAPLFSQPLNVRCM